uniref:Uncharacterized protein n=1 Tax=Ciona savignyi TaxID=51511 RepID=H2ZIR8_CIOSA
PTLPTEPIQPPQTEPILLPPPILPPSPLTEPTKPSPIDPTLSPPPPPPPKDLDERTKKLIRRLSERRKSQHFPPDPTLPPCVSDLVVEDINDTPPSTPTSNTLYGNESPTMAESYKEVTYLLGSDSDSGAPPSANNQPTDSLLGGSVEQKKPPTKAIVPEISPTPLLPDV